MDEWHDRLRNGPMTLERFKWLASHRYDKQQEYDNAVASYQLALLKQGKSF